MVGQQGRIPEHGSGGEEEKSWREKIGKSDGVGERY